MHQLTLIKGGKSDVRSPRPVANLADLTTEDLLLVQRNTIEEMVRKFHELQTMWSETKESYRHATLEQAAERRNHVLSMSKEVHHV